MICRIMIRNCIAIEIWSSNHRCIGQWSWIRSHRWILIQIRIVFRSWMAKWLSKIGRQIAIEFWSMGRSWIRIHRWILIQIRIVFQTWKAKRTPIKIGRRIAFEFWSTGQCIHESRTKNLWPQSTHRITRTHILKITRRNIRNFSTSHSTLTNIRNCTTAHTVVHAIPHTIHNLSNSRSIMTTFTPPNNCSSSNFTIHNSIHNSSW